jgi:hypothetical protein
MRARAHTHTHTHSLSRRVDTIYTNTFPILPVVCYKFATLGGVGGSGGTIAEGIVISDIECLFGRNYITLKQNRKSACE